MEKERKNRYCLLVFKAERLAYEYTQASFHKIPEIIGKEDSCYQLNGSYRAVYIRLHLEMAVNLTSPYTKNT